MQPVDCTIYTNLFQLSIHQVILGALQLAGLAPLQVSALEMHGTGTPLGDPIEVNAALEVLQRTGTSVHFSAAKSRVGHAEAAAGAVGVIQVSHVQLVSVDHLVSIRVSNPQIFAYNLQCINPKTSISL
jgi:hypothetical protein